MLYKIDGILRAKKLLNFQKRFFLINMICDLLRESVNFYFVANFLKIWQTTRVLARNKLSFIYILIIQLNTMRSNDVMVKIKCLVGRIISGKLQI